MSFVSRKNKKKTFLTGMTVLLFLFRGKNNLEVVP